MVTESQVARDAYEQGYAQGYAEGYAAGLAAGSRQEDWSFRLAVVLGVFLLWESSSWEQEYR